MGVKRKGLLYASSRGYLKFRDWFGVSFFWCTLKGILHSTFRVPKLRDWFGVARQTKEHGRNFTWTYMGVSKNSGTPKS